MKAITSLLCFLLALNGYSQTKPAASLPKQYPQLRAVLVVGHSQGQTENSIRSTERIATFFKERGVKTFSFYDKEADWKQIKEAAKGAHFFIYNGHGTAGGGLNIQSGGTTREISDELKLAPNAIIGFQSVCFGAGSSASDDNEICIGEGAKRVNWYAEPFFKAGAGCYYANNMDDGVLRFLQRLFDGENAKSTFIAYKTDTIMPYPIDKTKEIGLASVNFGGTSTRTSYKNGVKTVKEVPSHKSFEVAWVGPPVFSIKDILK